MGFIRKVFDFIAHPTRLRTAILIVFITVIAVPITVIVSQQQQSTKQRASGLDNACSPPYEGYLGCFALGNFPPDSTCTSSCSDPDGVAGQYCYSSTKIGKTCVTELNQVGACNDSGSCISTEAFPTPTPTEIPVVNVQDESLNSSPAVSISACASICGTNICATCSDGSSICGTIDLSNCPNVTPIPTTIPLVSPILIISPSPFPSPTSISITTTQNLIIPTIVVLTPTIAPCNLKIKGDADCDGKINDIDRQIWTAEFVNEINGLSTARKSDFDGKDGVSIVDFNIWFVSSQDPSVPHV